MTGFLPYRTPQWIMSIFPSLVWEMEADGIYLTFDDGPVPGVTEYVLDLLGQYNIKATFFCVGDNIRKHPDVFSRLIGGGHMVGNHTFNHLDAWQCPRSVYRDNIASCQAQLDLVPLVRDKRLFRPPHGRLTLSQYHQLTELYEVVMWSVLTQDFSSTDSSDDALQKSIRATRPGSIVVFHDNVKSEKKMRYMLPRFIDHFLAKGFEFKLL